MKRLVLCILLLSLVLSGCSGIFDSSYQNVQPHQEEDNQEEAQIVSVSNYTSLCATLRDLVADGAESSIISVARYDQDKVGSDMKKAVDHIIATDPIAAYAVEDIQFELGTNAGQPAVAVTVTYIHNRVEILKIHHLQDMEGVKTVLANALDECNSGIVLYVENFTDTDFTQWVADYTLDNPDKVMERPEVTANLYPEEGKARVVELKFLYQNSREALRDMQSKVSPLFSAAAIYAGQDGDEAERYFKLYSFLMGLFQTYQLDTSITPAYSLLQHGVGDSKAFATVYAAMCEEAGLECIVVPGTRSGEPWYWNIVCSEGIYYHVDLLACEQEGEFVMKADAEMIGCVWDYSAYPACGVEPLTEE